MIDSGYGGSKSGLDYYGVRLNKASLDWQRGHETLRRLGLQLTVTCLIQFDGAGLRSKKSVNNIWTHDLRSFLIVPISV
jgi:hypothetical protein